MEKMMGLEPPGPLLTEKEPADAGEKQSEAEAEVDEWWLQQQSNAARNTNRRESNNFQALQDIWPYGAQGWSQFAVAHRAKKPFMRILNKRRMARKMVKKQDEEAKKQAEVVWTKWKQTRDETNVSSAKTDVTSGELTDDGRNSTDLEAEIRQVHSPVKILRASNEGEIEELINKYTSYSDVTITDRETKELLRSYVTACQKRKVPVLRAVVKAISHDAITVIDIRHYSTSAESLLPLVEVLENNQRITTLILEDCGLGLSSGGGELVASIIERHVFLKNLNIGSNFLGPRFVHAIVNALERNRSLEYINLSRNKFTDGNCARLIEVLGAIDTVNALDISGNEIGNETAGILTDWLLQAECKLKILNIGWCAIRRETASSICSGLRLNWGLRIVDLSFNGLASEGALALGEALRSNNRIKSLDISGNRLRNESAKMLAEGLTKNVGLYNICLKDNPIGMEGILAIMKAIHRNRKSGLRIVDFSGMPVNPKVLQIADAIKYRIQNAPVKQKTAQQLAQQKRLQEQYGAAVTSNLETKDFEFIHGPVIAVEGHSFFEVPQKGLEYIVIHRFSDELQKHCANVRLIDIFRSCAPQGDKGVTMQEFVRGFMKQIPLTEDELKHTATALDPESAITDFVNFNTFYGNFRILRRSYFGDDASSHRLRWMAKYQPLVTGIAEGVFLSTYQNDRRLDSIQPSLVDIKIARLKGIVTKERLQPVSRALRNMERKELLTKGTWLLRPERFEQIVVRAKKSGKLSETSAPTRRRRFMSKLPPIDAVGDLCARTPSVKIDTKNIYRGMSI